MHFFKMIVNKGQMLLNMHARLVWVGIILFSSLDGNYKSEIENVYQGNSYTFNETK